MMNSMIFSNYKLFKLVILILMIIISIFSCYLNDYLMIWMFMEINTMLFFTYYVMNEIKFKYKVFMYFFIQSISSMMILMLIFLLNLYSNSFDEMIIMMINLILFFKMGMPPFHQWYLNLISKMNWLTILYLFTLQKFIPLILLSNFIELKYLIFLMFIYLFLMKNMFNEHNIKIIMGYSSMYYTLWLLILLLMNKNLFLLFFILYFLTSFIIMVIFNMNNLIYFKDLMLMDDKGKKMMIFVMMFISMLPPMLLFLLKWLFFYSLMRNDLLLFSIMLILISLVYIFLYIRMLMFSMVKQNISKIMFFKTNNLFKYLIFYLVISISFFIFMF